MFRYIGMALGLVEDQRRKDDIAAGEAADIAMAEAFAIKKSKPLVEKMFDTTLELLERMNEREKRLLVQIDELNEELRQTRIVREGASKMMGDLERGMNPLPLVSREVPAAPALD